MKPHAFHPEAAGEYADAANYYAQIDPELGGRFYDEMIRDKIVNQVRQARERHAAKFNYDVKAMVIFNLRFDPDVFTCAKARIWVSACPLTPAPPPTGRMRQP